MKKAIFFILIINSFNSFSQESPVMTKKHLVEEIILTYNKMQVFENKFEESNSDEYEDSITKENFYLVQLFSNKQFDVSDSSLLKRIREQTGIKIILSKDYSLVIVSWGAFNSYPIPLCSNLIFFKGKIKIISLNGTGTENDFGDNIQIDTVCTIHIKARPYYILIGSNKCGNLCIEERASLYRISNGEIIKSSNSFFDGKKYFNDIRFNYLINDLTKVEPVFLVQNTSLISPLFNKDKTKVTGNKKYKIMETVK